MYINSRDEDKNNTNLNIAIPVVKLYNFAIVEDDVSAVVADRGPGQLTCQREVGYDTEGGGGQHLLPFVKLVFLKL